MYATSYRERCLETLTIVGKFFQEFGRSGACSAAASAAIAAEKRAAETAKRNAKSTLKRNHRGNQRLISGGLLGPGALPTTTEEVVKRNLKRKKEEAWAAEVAKQEAAKKHKAEVMDGHQTLIHSTDTSTPQPWLTAMDIDKVLSPPNIFSYMYRDSAIF